MKSGEMARFLRARGCAIKRQGGKHELWHSPFTDKPFAVPRGGIKSKGTYFDILKQAGIKK